MELKKNEPTNPTPLLNFSWIVVDCRYENTINLIDPAYMKNITVKMFYTDHLEVASPDLTEIYDSSKVKKIANIPRMVKAI